MRGRGYPARGYQQSNNYHGSNISRGRSYDNQGSSSGKKVGTSNNSDVECMLCGLKGHKVATCRKLSRAQELLRKDKQRYWNEKRKKGRNNASRDIKSYQINEVDEASLASNEDFHYEEEEVNADYKGIEEINFPCSEFTEEEDLAYYNDDWLNLEQIEEITNTTSSPNTLYKAQSNRYNFMAKIDSGASHKCISKSLWDKIKTTNKLAKSHFVLTGAGGSK